MTDSEWPVRAGMNGIGWDGVLESLRKGESLF